MVAYWKEVNKGSHISDEKEWEKPINNTVSFLLKVLGAKIFKQKRKRFTFVKRKEKYDTERF